MEASAAPDAPAADAPEVEAAAPPSQRSPEHGLVSALAPQPDAAAQEAAVRHFKVWG